MKKRISFIFSCVLFTFLLNAQSSILARYNVTESISIAGEGEKKIPFTLTYEGRIYKQDSKVLLYLRPEFLEEYPEGRITIPYPGGTSIYLLNNDSMHFPQVYHTDSLQTWFCNNSSSRNSRHEYVTFKYNSLPGQWELLPETKMINGLLCKHARLSYINTDKLLVPKWDIWYYADISFPFFFSLLKDAPGLVVEADNYQTNIHYSLKNLETNISIPADTFWPAMFKNTAFINLDTRQKEINKKQTKQRDIMAQQ